MADGEFSRGDFNRAQRMFPFQNAFGVRQAFTGIKDGIYGEPDNR